MTQTDTETHPVYRMKPSFDAIVGTASAGIGLLAFLETVYGFSWEYDGSPLGQALEGVVPGQLVVVFVAGVLAMAALWTARLALTHLTTRPPTTRSTAVVATVALIGLLSAAVADLWIGTWTAQQDLSVQLAWSAELLFLLGILSFIPVISGCLGIAIARRVMH